MHRMLDAYWYAYQESGDLHPSFLLPFPFGLERQQTSGLAVKHMINVGAGIIDSNYRGPVGVVLFNFGLADFVIKAGDRVA